MCGPTPATAHNMIALTTALIYSVLWGDLIDSLRCVRSGSREGCKILRAKLTLDTQARSMLASPQHVRRVCEGVSADGSSLADILYYIDDRMRLGYNVISTKEYFHSERSLQRGIRVTYKDSGEKHMIPENARGTLKYTFLAPVMNLAGLRGWCRPFPGEEPIMGMAIYDSNKNRNFVKPTFDRPLDITMEFWFDNRDDVASNQEEASQAQNISRKRSRQGA